MRAMKSLAISLMFALSTLAIAEERPISQEAVNQIQKLKSRCEWAVSIPGELDHSPLLKSLIEFEKTHPWSLAKIGEYWDAKATKDLTETLEHLDQKEARNRIDLSDEVHRQNGLYYLENLSAIRAMADRLLNWPAETAAKQE
jgi:hypothetical protein